ncbi:acyltransferase-domain-containing protein [Rhizopus microsporus]|uniref:Acyltransferase-domain-containing protein n=1 Tax=Rhizopus microsporus TaxID=58291 RepID=A0A1X0S876_RHIZD|nr:acyltransferase-domain-containing protein [Rhizopus microsporus]
MNRSRTTEYTHEQLLSYAKCFTTNVSKRSSKWLELLDIITSIPSVLVRYGIIFPLRFISLGVSTAAFFTALPIAVTLKSDRLVSMSVKYYCKGILFSLGVKVNYIGNKPTLNKPHVFVANHTSYLDYILLSADRFPHAVVMAKHTGALGFLQNNGLNYLHSMTFDRSNITERKQLSASLKKHVEVKENWKNPMIIFPEGTCVNNKYIIRFQKGAFDLGVSVCPVGIKMTRWITTVDVIYCEPQSPKEDESSIEYSDRVKGIIASSAGLEQVDFNGMAKRDLLNALEMEKRGIKQ